MSSETLRLVLITLCYSLLVDSQRQDVDYFQPSQRNQGSANDLPSGRGRSLGLAIDEDSLDKARQIFPLIFSAPSSIYVVIFNTTRIMKGKRVNNGWPGVDAWIRQEGLSNEAPQQFNGPQYGGNPRTDSRGGAALYTLLSLAQELPPSSALALITSRPPSDTDLAGQAQTALIEKKIPLAVFWTDKEKNGRALLEKIAYYTGGSFQEVKDDINSLRQVTLLVRENQRGDSRSKVEVDSSLKDLTVTIKGHVASAALLPPGGYGFDLLQKNERSELSKKKINLNGRDTGTWYLDIRGADEPYSATVEATSHLALWATATNSSKEAKKVVELWLEGRGIRRVDEIELVDSEGRQLAALGHRETRSDDNTVSSTVELDSIATRQPSFLRLTATNNNGEQFTRVTRIPDEMRLPTSIEVGLGSMLMASPGQRAVIYFNVANNRRQPMYYDYIVNDRNRWVRYVNPTRSLINGQSVDQIKVEVQAPYSNEAQNQQPDIITFRAQLMTGESVTQSALFRIGQTDYDSTSPTIFYSFNGDCSNTLSPDNCYIGTWGANVTVQDTGSGLLQITSTPVALQLSREFIAGTQDLINARFMATCCQTKVEVSAIDILGNKYTKTIDIERKWLTAGEISAIVLAVILLLLFIAVIIILVCWCCRRNKRSLAIYPDH